MYNTGTFMKITRSQLKQLIKEEMRKPQEWKYADLVKDHGKNAQGVPNLTIDFNDDGSWTIGPNPGKPYRWHDIITGVPENIIK